MLAPETRRALRGALIAASWANLVMLPEWEKLLQPEVSAAAWLRPSASGCWAAVIVVVLFAGAGAVAGCLIRVPERGIRRSVMELGVLAIAGLALNSVRVLNDFGFPRAEAWVDAHRLVALVAGAAIATALVRWRRPAARGAVACLLMASPFVLVTTGRAAFVALRGGFEQLDPQPERVSFAATTAGPRVVIVVFDELDFGLAFRRRPAGLRLDEMDRLRREGFFATDVQPTSTIGTNLAIPSLLTGTLVDSVVRENAGSTRVRYKGEVFHDLARSETLFDDAAALRAPSEVVGGQLPYCRWRLAAFTRRCTWLPMSGVLDGPLPLGEAVARQLRAFAGPIAVRDSRIRALQYLTNVGLRASADEANRLVFIHLLVPHWPYIWDRERQTFTRTRFRKHGYFDNLALADRILGQLRDSVAKSGVGDRTIFVVTADHGFRSGAINGIMPDQHVPFAVVFPADSATAWDEPVSVVPLRRLVGVLLRGEVRSGAQLAEWMRGVGSVGSSDVASHTGNHR